MIERRYDLDWLRLIALGLVIIVHCLQVFSVDYTWYVFNPDRTRIVDYIAEWPLMWVMPLFFLISGFASWHALRTRSNRQYLLARIKRLLIPLYTAGLFILFPVIYFFVMPQSGIDHGSSWEAIPGYFAELGKIGLHPCNLIPTPYTGSLWFLKFVFLISIITLPLMRFLFTEKGLHLIRQLAGWFSQRGGIIIFIIPVILIRLTLTRYFPDEHGVADFAEYTFYFVAGLVIAADKRFSQAIGNNLWAGLGLGICSYALLILALVGWSYKCYDWNHIFSHEPFSMRFLFFQTVYAIGRCGWILAVLGLGARFLNSNSRALAYWGEAVLPFYILHETVVLSVAWFVVKWDLAIIPKLMIIIAASVSIIVFLYHFIVRRFGFTRFIFGMAPKKKPSTAPAQLQNAGTLMPSSACQAKRV